MFIRVEGTPNPKAVKFFPYLGDKQIVSSAPMYFTSLAEAVHSSLARKILEVEGISAVFFGKDFITVTKGEVFDWDVLKPEIVAIITNHIMSGLDCIDHVETKQKVESFGDVEKEIIQIIEEKVRPAVANDGGDITYVDFKDGVVYLKMHGACVGCPSSTVTLKNGIEAMLKHYVPEVVEVRNIDE